MKVGISTSTWFQVVPFCSLISEQFFSALGWFFTPSVIFYDLRGNLHWDDLKWPKNHFRVAKHWFWGVECKFWGHIEKCFRFFRSGTGSAIFRVRKIVFSAFSFISRLCNMFWHLHNQTFDSLEPRGVFQKKKKWLKRFWEDKSAFLSGFLAQMVEISTGMYWKALV